MGGEPLLRPDFIHKVVNYAARKNSLSIADKRSFDEARGHRPAGDAGLATVNLAIDAGRDNKPCLKKAFGNRFVRIRLSGKTSTGTLWIHMALNCNITRIIIEDIKTVD